MIPEKKDMQPANVPDIRDLIFAGLGEHQFTARLTATAGGILAGLAEAEEQAAAVGLALTWHYREGNRLEPGATVASLTGRAQAIAVGEERVLGCLCKASGIATSARRAVDLANGRVRVVSGAWKKMPPALKMMVRQAVAAGGMPSRILDVPFIYLDKNYVRMLGGITATLAAVADLPGVKVIQVRGEEASVAEETVRACQAGAGVVMVDTGRAADAVAALEAATAFPEVKVCFAGGIHHQDIPALAHLGLHILDIGTVIMDAPLLDMKLDVLAVKG
jgi:nicotinate-nucleotide pyrophosphorylase (carboxylating)